jgi:IS30 family transposase
MGQKRDVTETEKSKMEKCLSDGSNTLEIAKLLRHDHRTIKRFVCE